MPRRDNSCRLAPTACRAVVRPRPYNIAPRIGFAWTANSEASMVVRGGYGIYYNQGALATSEGLLQPTLLQSGRLLPVPGAAADQAVGSVPRVVPYSGSAIGDRVSARPADAVDGALQRYAAARDRTVRTVEIGYVGSRGHDLISARDGNQPPASPSPFNFRPNPAFADITLIESRASSRYNSLQFRCSSVPESGLSMLWAYTHGQVHRRCFGFFTSAGDPNFPRTAWIRRRRRAARRSTSARLTAALPVSPAGDGRRWLS